MFPSGPRYCLNREGENRRNQFLERGFVAMARTDQLLRHRIGNYHGPHCAVGHF